MHPLRLVTRAALVAVTVTVLGAVPAAASNDPRYGEQYGLQQVKAPSAWARTRGAGITIAVVDSGVDLDHPDLVGRLVAGHDFVDGDERPQDGVGHGTHVAGVAAATADNGVGIAGVAPAARIMPIRVLDDTGAGTLEQVKAGIRWAADHGARVINLSLGPETSLLGLLFGSGNFEEEITDAWSKGAVVVVAAGNSSTLLGSGGASGYSFDVKAVVVTATDAAERMPSWANRADSRWAISAPGDAILSTVLDGYDRMSGTSMAAPHVSGAAALLLSQGLSNVQVVTRLLSSARPLGEPAVRGAGLLDVAGAVAGTPAPTVPAPSPRPAPAPPPPAAPATTPVPAAPAPAAATPAAAPTTAAPAPSAAATGAPTTLPPSTTAPAPGSPERSVTLAAGRSGDDGGDGPRVALAVVAAVLVVLAAAAAVLVPARRSR